MSKVGEIHITTEGYTTTIIKSSGWNDCDIQFENGVILKSRCYQHIKRGNIKNPLHKYLYGVGYMGIGKYSDFTDERLKKIRTVWCKMFTRSYCPKYKERQPTYKDCSVDGRWHCFQDFAEWCEENYTEGWHLDKDLLNDDIKIYSPDTCTFVPQVINNLFTNCTTKRDLPTGVCKDGLKYRAQINKGSGVIYLGVFSTISEASECYTKEKIKWAMELAEKYKDRLDIRVYKKLNKL